MRQMLRGFSVIFILSMSVAGCATRDRVVTVVVNEDLLAGRDSCVVHVYRAGSQSERRVPVSAASNSLNVVVSSTGAEYSFRLKCSGELVAEKSVVDRNVVSGVEIFDKP